MSQYPDATFIKSANALEQFVPDRGAEVARSHRGEASEGPVELGQGRDVQRPATQPGALETRIGVGRVVETCQLLMHQAAALGELKGDTNTEQLGRHLGIQLLAVLGMWGSGFFTNQESIRQVKRAWCGVLLQHCGDTLRPQLEAAYRSTLRTEG